MQRSFCGHPVEKLLFGKAPMMIGFSDSLKSFVDLDHFGVSRCASVKDNSKELIMNQMLSFGINDEVNGLKTGWQKVDVSEVIAERVILQRGERWKKTLSAPVRTLYAKSNQSVALLVGSREFSIGGKPLLWSREGHFDATLCDALDTVELVNGENDSAVIDVVIGVDAPAAEGVKTDAPVPELNVADVNHDATAGDSKRANRKK